MLSIHLISYACSTYQTIQLYDKNTVSFHLVRLFSPFLLIQFHVFTCQFHGSVFCVCVCVRISGDTQNLKIKFKKGQIKGKIEKTYCAHEKNMKRTKRGELCLLYKTKKAKLKEYLIVFRCGNWQYHFIDSVVFWGFFSQQGLFSTLFHLQFDIIQFVDCRFYFVNLNHRRDITVINYFKQVLIIIP